MWTTAVCVAAALAWAGAQSAPGSAAAPFPIVGVKTGIDKKTGQPPARLNINTLWTRGGPQWDLYILALSQLKALNETDELSYFAIAGIHGFPHSAWNGVDHVDGAPVTGFCPHGELLFVTWHRPYVALFEQVLVSHAVRIAGQYPPDLAPEYAAAARTLRQPYWDWASDPTLPPAVFGVNVTVAAPWGVVEMENPLYSYHFQRPDVELSFGGFLATKPGTFRCLGSNGMLSNVTECNEKMVSVAEDLTNYVYDTFTRTKSYDGMASDEWRVASFELPHNLVHIQAACNGTLSDVNWSAFEPLFMLHHCNIDRLAAMWQVINYDDAMFTGTAYSTGQFATPRDTPITADSPLKPFFDENMNFHTSNSVANITTFGYTYPEMPDWTMPPEARADHVRAYVNALYSKGANGLGRAQAMDKLGVTEYKNYYTAEIVVDRSEVPLPSTVGLVVEGKAVAHMSMLAMPHAGLASVSLPLQDMTIGNRSLKDLPPEKVVPFLQQRLTMEIRMSNGTEVPVRAVPSLQLQIQNLEYIPRANESTFPAFGNAIRWPVEVRQHGGCC